MHPLDIDTTDDSNHRRDEVALEELSGRLVEELASYRPLDPTQSTRKEYKEVAGRFARYDPVRRAILALDNAGDARDH